MYNKILDNLKKLIIQYKTELNIIISKTKNSKNIAFLSKENKIYIFKCLSNIYIVEKTINNKEYSKFDYNFYLKKCYEKCLSNNYEKIKILSTTKFKDDANVICSNKKKEYIFFNYKSDFFLFKELFIEEFNLDKITNNLIDVYNKYAKYKNYDFLKEIKFYINDQLSKEINKKNYDHMYNDFLDKLNLNDLLIVFNNKKIKKFGNNILMSDLNFINSLINNNIPVIFIDEEKTPISIVKMMKIGIFNSFNEFDIKLIEMFKNNEFNFIDYDLNEKRLNIFNTMIKKYNN